MEAIQQLYDSSIRLRGYQIRTKTGEKKLLFIKMGLYKGKGEEDMLKHKLRYKHKDNCTILVNPEELRKSYNTFKGLQTYVNSIFPDLFDKVEETVWPYGQWFRSKSSGRVYMLTIIDIQNTSIEPKYGFVDVQTGMWRMKKGERIVIYRDISIPGGVLFNPIDYNLEPVDKEPFITDK